MRGQDPPAGFKSNAYIIFDYESATKFKYVGAAFNGVKWRIGQYDNGWNHQATDDTSLATDTDVRVDVLIEGQVVTVFADGIYVDQRDFSDPTDPLTDGPVGLGVSDAFADFDNFAIEPLDTSLPFTQTFDGTAPALLDVHTGTWSLEAGRFAVQPPAGRGPVVAIAHTSATFPDDLHIGAIINGTGPFNPQNAYIIFDFVDIDNFKYAGIAFVSNKWRIGHYQNGTWTDDVSKTDKGLEIDIDYDVDVVLRGSIAMLYSSGLYIGQFDFGEPLNDGRVGLGTKNAKAEFDELIIQPYGATLAHQETFDLNRGFFEKVGAVGWMVQNGRFKTTPDNTQVPIATLNRQGALPNDFEFAAVVNGTAPGGQPQNAYLLFDYQGPTDFKYAGPAFGSTQKWRIGHYDGTTWDHTGFTFDDASLGIGTDIHVALAIEGNKVTLYGNDVYIGERDFGTALSAGEVGLATNRAHAEFDDVTLTAVTTTSYTDNFDDARDQWQPISGQWATEHSRLEGAAPTGSGTAAGDTALNLLPDAGRLPTQHTIAATVTPRPGPFGSTAEYAFIVFDYQSESDYKFAGAYLHDSDPALAGTHWVIGHFDGTDFIDDAKLAAPISVDTAYNLELEVDGGVATLKVGGIQVATHDYDTDYLTRGRTGVGTHQTPAHFDDLTAPGDPVTTDFTVHPDGRITWTPPADLDGKQVNIELTVADRLPTDLDRRIDVQKYILAVAGGIGGRINNLGPVTTDSPFTVNLFEDLDFTSR